MVVNNCLSDENEEKLTLCLRCTDDTLIIQRVVKFIASSGIYQLMLS